MFWVWDLVCSDDCEASCVFVCVCAFRSVILTLITTTAFAPQSNVKLAVCFCVFVCVCAFRPVILTLITTAAFAPQSKEELKDAVTQC